MRLQEVLEPFQSPEEGGGQAFYDDEAPYAPYGEESPYEEGEAYAQEPYQEEAYGNPYEEEYSDYHEQLDHEGRLHTAMGVLNTAGVLVGVVVILVLVAMLFSLVSWLQNDILHSITLLQGGIS